MNVKIINMNNQNSITKWSSLHLSNLRLTSQEQAQITEGVSRIVLVSFPRNLHCTKSHYNPFGGIMLIIITAEYFHRKLGGDTKSFGYTVILMFFWCTESYREIFRVFPENFQFMEGKVTNDLSLSYGKVCWEEVSRKVRYNNLKVRYNNFLKFLQKKSSSLNFLRDFANPVWIIA